MDVVGIGVDLTDVERVSTILKRRRSFIDRVFTPEEIAYCQRQANPVTIKEIAMGNKNKLRKKFSPIT